MTVNVLSPRRYRPDRLRPLSSAMRQHGGEMAERDSHPGDPPDPGPAGRPRLVQGLRLQRLVGRGGEGEVWEARDARGRRRAVKLIRPEALASHAAVAERAAYLRRIDHPALVRVHRSGLLDEGALSGWGIVEMDYVDGRSLARVPGDWGLLDELLPLAAALDLLHDGHWSDGVPLVHRDVKPANLVEAPDGRLVLVDPSTLRGVDAALLTRIGTPVFAAPEVVTGRVGPPADVYSLAVTVIALVTGARGEELAELVDRVGELDLPPGVRAGVAAAPQDRPASCHDLLTEPHPVLVRDAERADSHGGWTDGWGWTDGEAMGDLEDSADVGPAPRGRVWPWFLVLVLVLVAPVVTWAAGMLEGPLLPTAAAAAVATQLAAHAADRRSVLLALVAPPLAWAFLLSDRVAAGRRRAWARALLCGALAVAVAPVAMRAVGTGVGDEVATAAVTVAGTGLTGLALVAVGARGATGLLLRTVLLPVWAAGAALLVAAGLVALPVAALTGRTRVAARLVFGTLAGAVEALRSPR